MMDMNHHPLRNKLYTKLKEKHTKMKEFMHKCWGPKEAHTYHSVNSPIDGGYKTPEVEIVNLSMLTFAESPGDHRSFILYASTRSLLGVYRYKICQPVNQQLVTLQELTVKRYNEIIRDQFEIHRLEEQLNMVDNMTRYCGYPSPWWLRSMIIMLYKQMIEIRDHAEKNCRKILHPNDNYNPTIQMWYNRIHAYLQLIRMKEGKTNNNGKGSALCMATRYWQTKGTYNGRIGLQFGRIRKAELRKQAKGLRKVHLCNCLIDAMDDKQKTRAAAIKQKINREESKWMQYLIKQTVRDPQSPSILKLQRVINREVQEYETKEDVKNAIQRECKVCFSLAHSAPIMSTLLSEWLRYLSDEALARAIITGTYEIPPDMDPATKLILAD
jgi:hypothetical protein